MKKVFISGPVTGLDYQEVKRRFDRAEQKLLMLGYQVFNPMTFVKPTNDWVTAMKKCLKILSLCDSIYMLKGFQTSRGSMIEFKISYDLEYEIMFEDDLKTAA
jgi:hypothetical protein